MLTTRTNRGFLVWQLFVNQSKNGWIQRVRENNTKIKYIDKPYYNQTLITQLTFGMEMVQIFLFGMYLFFVIPTPFTAVW